MDEYLIVFIGHIGCDDISRFQEERTLVMPSGAALYGLITVSKLSDKKIAVVTRIAEKDVPSLESLKKKTKADFYITPSGQTHYLEVVYPSANPEDRRLILKKCAGSFKGADMPDILAKCVNLAGNTDKEFTLEFIQSLKNRGHSISIDMQSFVRHVDKDGRIAFSDVEQKKKIVSLSDKIKMDCVEAEILTGTNDLKKAAKIVQSWGCPEVVITSNEGVLAQTKDGHYFGKFTNSSNSGRNGRGDTTFAAYLLWRTSHDVKESVKFAAAAASIKLESPGPFNGSLEKVLARMKKDAE